MGIDILIDQILVLSFESNSTLEPSRAATEDMHLHKNIKYSIYKHATISRKKKREENLVEFIFLKRGFIYPHKGSNVHKCIMKHKLFFFSLFLC